MSADVHVVLGLARPRTVWFDACSRWASSAAVPIEFHRCVSVDELTARLQTAAPPAAVILGGDAVGVDRDLLALIEGHGVPAVVISDDGVEDWRRLGASMVLPTALTAEMLRGVFDRWDRAHGLQQAFLPDPVRNVELAPVVAIVGAGGTGTSTAAIAAAQGLAAALPSTAWQRRDTFTSGQSLADAGPQDVSLPVAGTKLSGSVRPTSGLPVILADLCRQGDQAMLHRTAGLVPGFQDLVTACRNSFPDVAAVHATTFDIDDHGYRLVVGLRRPNHWVGLGRAAVATAIDAMATAASVVVADLDPDLEGEAETGSYDVEDRHLASRLALSRASVVAITIEGSGKGLHTALRLFEAVLRCGVSVRRILPVVVPASLAIRQRTALNRLLADLIGPGLAGAVAGLQQSVVLPRREVDAALMDGRGVPAPLPRLMARGILQVLDDQGILPSVAAQPAPIVPAPLTMSGSFGGGGR